MASEKVLIVCSSPNKQGKTNSLVNVVADLFTQKGLITEVVDIANLNFKTNGCIACFGCQKSDKYECVVKDDATPLLEKMAEFQYHIYASPIYFFGVNAQLKLFLDRTFCLYKMDDATGEYSTCLKDVKFGLISTAGGGIEHGLGLADETFKAMAAFSDTKYSSLLIGYTAKIDNMAKDQEVLDKVNTFVEEITT